MALRFLAQSGQHLISPTLAHKIGTGDFTLFALAKARTQYEDSSLWSNGTVGYPDNPTLQFFADSGNNYKWAWYPKDSPNYLTAGETLSLDTWYGLCAWRTGTTITLERDGIYKASGTFNGNVPSDVQYIANDNEGGGFGFFDGAIAWVALWRRALSARARFALGDRFVHPMTFQRDMIFCADLTQCSPVGHVLDTYNRGLVWTVTAGPTLVTTNPRPVTLRHARAGMFVSGGPIVQAIGQVVETELAQSFGKLKALGFLQATETDTNQAFTSSKLKLLGQTVETELAQVVTALKTKAITQTTETELAQSLIQSKVLAVGQVSEIELAQNLGRLKSFGIGQALEADSANAVSRSGQTVAMGQASSSELAQPISALKAQTIGQATELDIVTQMTPVGGYSDPDNNNWLPLFDN